MGVGGAGLDEWLDATPQPIGQTEIAPDEWVSAVHGGKDQHATRSKPAAEMLDGRRRVVEMLDREGREDHVEGLGRKRIAIDAQVDGRELVQVGERARFRGMDVGADEALDPGPISLQVRDPAAARVEDGDARAVTVPCPRLTSVERLIERRGHQLIGRRGLARIGQDREASRLRGIHHAPAVVASLIPSDSSQRSASMAALQPSAAAVTA